MAGIAWSPARLRTELTALLGETAGIDSAGESGENLRFPGELSIGSGTRNFGSWIDHRAVRRGDAMAKGRTIAALFMYLGAGDALGGIEIDPAGAAAGQDNAAIGPKSAPLFREVLVTFGPDAPARDRTGLP